jgi:hypothetical protein
MATGTPFDQPFAGSGTSLEMLGNSSVVQRWADPQTPLRREFLLGVDSLVRHSFMHEPPRPIELEHAIELTEDAVMPLAAEFAGDTNLVLRGFGAVVIACGLDAIGLPRTALTLEEVETLFNRLVAVSEGRPTSQEGLPANGRFFAAMLFLREFMHHLRFANVTLQPEGDPG